LDYTISTTRVTLADTACRPRLARRSGHSGRRPIAAAHQIDLASNLPIDLIDITDRVASVVGRLGPWAGTATIFSRHTTAAVRIQEDEPLLLDDLRAFLLRLAPPEAAYGHNDFDVRTEHMHADERPNGHAHCLHLLLGASASVPVADGALHLGTWQRIFFIDLDGPRSDRAVQVQLTGLSSGWSSAPWP
jgi:secondary thiamine-phosphate synthase enzyme